MTISACRKTVEPVFKKLSFNMTLHQLRHTYSTSLHKLGVDPKMHQYLMGHADLQTTLNIYTKVQRNQVEQVALKISDILTVSQG